MGHSEFLRVVTAVASLAVAGLALASDTTPPSRVACSSLVLDNGGHALFGANLDHVTASEGQVFINKRSLAKTSLYAGTTGRHAHWRSRYASVTFNLVGYPFAWAGMNEAGLVLSTMSLDDTEVPPPDQRPPLDSGEWMQYILDTCATIPEVVASDADVRIFTVDHYLVTDRWGNSATIEFLDGEMVVHDGADLPVSALTNTKYADAVSTWLQYPSGCAHGWFGGSLARFCLAADRVQAFQPTNAEAAVAYAFDSLEAIRGEDFSIHTSQWSLVFDARNLRAYFRTHHDPSIRFVDLVAFRLRCDEPTQMLDVQEPIAGDTAGFFFELDYQLCFDQLRWFTDLWGLSLSDQTIHSWLQHFLGFPCVAEPPRQPSGRVGLPP